MFIDARLICTDYTTMSSMATLHLCSVQFAWDAWFTTNELGLLITGMPRVDVYLAKQRVSTDAFLF